MCYSPWNLVLCGFNLFSKGFLEETRPALLKLGSWPKKEQWAGCRLWGVGKITALPPYFCTEASMQLLAGRPTLQAALPVAARVAIPQQAIHGRQLCRQPGSQLVAANLQLPSTEAASKGDSTTTLLIITLWHSPLPKLLSGSGPYSYAHRTFQSEIAEIIKLTMFKILWLWNWQGPAYKSRVASYITEEIQVCKCWCVSIWVGKLAFCFIFQCNI